jgi:hypothetical protein
MKIYPLILRVDYDYSDKNIIFANASWGCMEEILVFYMNTLKIFQLC